jgi:hypothetical protein
MATSDSYAYICIDFYSDFAMPFDDAFFDLLDSSNLFSVDDDIIPIEVVMFGWDEISGLQFDDNCCS